MCLSNGQDALLLSQLFSFRHSALSERRVFLWMQAHRCSERNVALTWQISAVVVQCLWISNRKTLVPTPNISERSVSLASHAGVVLFVFLPVSKPISSCQWFNVKRWSRKLVWSPNTEMVAVSAPYQMSYILLIILTPSVSWAVFSVSLFSWLSGSSVCSSCWTPALLLWRGKPPPNSWET